MADLILLRAAASPISSGFIAEVAPPHGGLQKSWLSPIEAMFLGLNVP